MTATPYRFEVVGDFPPSFSLVCDRPDCECTVREGRTVDGTDDVVDALGIVDELRRKGYRNLSIAETVPPLPTPRL